MDIPLIAADCFTMMIACICVSSTGEPAFAEAYRVEVMAHLPRSVKPPTLYNHGQGWKRSLNYLGKLLPGESPGEYLEAVPDGDSRTKVMWIANFATTFYVDGERGTRVHTLIGHVRASMTLHMKETEFFEEFVVLAAVKAGRPNEDELRQMADTGGAKPSLLTLMTVLETMRTDYWIRQGWDAEGADKHAV